MKTFRVTLECVLDVEAESDEDAWEKLPDEISIGDMYVLDTQEIEEEEKA